MTEPKACRLLCNWAGVGQFEGWIAEQDWQVVPGGWTFIDKLHSWRFRIAVIPGGLQIAAGKPGDDLEPRRSS
jgi:hypothetical protein